jgi:hypothetical protein
VASLPLPGDKAASPKKGGFVGFITGLSRTTIGVICCLCVCLVVIVVIYVVSFNQYLEENFNKKERRELKEVDFGASRFDPSCKISYKPESMATKRAAQSPSSAQGYNRSFITHGLGVQDGTYPYLAFLHVYTNKTSSRCSATVVDERHILTSAHCVAEKNRSIEETSWESDFVKPSALVFANLAATRGWNVIKAADELKVNPYNSSTAPSKVVRAEAIFIHADYDSVSDGATDIALIRINETLKWTDTLKPVCLAGFKDSLPPTCVAFGYGKDHTSSENIEGYLFSAPGIKSFTSSECMSGEIRQKIGEQVDEQLPFFDYFQNKIERKKVNNWYMPVLMKDKLCSIIVADKRGICHGDSGGPLCCTPEGVKANPNYFTSPLLLSKTDPTLKQFGVSIKVIAFRKCGTVDMVSIFTSVKAHRLWLEFVAYPALQNEAEYRKLEKTRFDACLENMDWASIGQQYDDDDLKEVLWEKHKKLLQLNICRKLNQFMYCSENSKENFAWCDNLHSTALDGFGELTFGKYVDLLPFFKKERCRQLQIGC